ncbi:MAG: hypothetical protein ACI83W_001259 [Marinoscillum sp.]
MSTPQEFQKYEQMEVEQLPVPKHKLHNWTHFAGLYAVEHVAATEFVIGATFVALGAKTTLPGAELSSVTNTLIQTPKIKARK